MQSARHHYALDLLRGMAALGIVFWHYNQFFFVAPETAAPGFALSDQPLYWLFLPFYRWGYLAVQLFFVLSGYVFFHVYATTIAEGRISLARFFVLRLSRLYPLQLVTLVVVALLQAVIIARTGQPFAYGGNTPANFLQHLFFVQGWGFEKGFSFNGPSWSVSLELLVYALFFAAASLGFASIRGAVVLVGAGLLVMLTNSPGIGQAIAGFFLGGLIYRLAGLLEAPDQRRERRLAMAAALVGIAIAGAGLVFVPWDIAQGIVTFAIFPAAVFVLSLIEVDRPALFARFKPFGDITYATYLLHFPVQLAIVLTLALLGWHADFHGVGMLLLYVALVVGLALPTYRWFERPAQNFLRSLKFALPLRRRLGHRDVQSLS